MQTTNKVQTGNTVTGTSTTTTASQWQTYNHYQAEKGWECPRCGSINAPWVRQCDCSRSEKWEITWNKDDCAKPWWYDYKVTCDGTSAQAQINSETFKVHPDGTVYTTAHNHVVGGSDYWDKINKTWTNTPDVSNDVTTKEDIPWYKYITLTSNKINELQTQINNLKETK